MAEFDTDFLAPNGTEANGTTHYDKVNFTSKASLISMAGYSKPESPSAITADDSVLTAIAKLESGAADSHSALQHITITDSTETNTGAEATIGNSDSVTIKLPDTIKASITGNCSGSSGICTGNSMTATTAFNIPTQSGSGNIWIE